MQISMTVINYKKEIAPCSNIASDTLKSKGSALNHFQHKLLKDLPKSIADKNSLLIVKGLEEATGP
jgi:hypothetical protein